MFTPLAAAAGVRLELRAAPEALAAADSAAVRQVLLNFLDNATRYGPRGQRVRVGVERAGPTARVWVEDEGPGVPPAERTRVFAPYYRMARDAAVTGGGSGIGLAVVGDLAERQGGRAWVEAARPEPGAPRASTAGAGARFVVEFPAAHEAEVRASAARGGTPAGGVRAGAQAGSPAAGSRGRGGTPAAGTPAAGTPAAGTPPTVSDTEAVGAAGVGEPA
jgi:hypothetical protein